MLAFTMWVFLDFDGVTHPYFPRADLTDAQNQHFSFLPTIEAVLRRHPHVGIVIASSWRHSHKYPLNVLRLKFSPDLRDRVVGTTPDIPVQPGQSDDGSRQAEVEAWLASHGQSHASWVALEDVLHLYRPGATVVAVPDFFGEREAELLEAALTDPVTYARQHPVPPSFAPTK
jgi:hypothetical protein